MTKKTKNKASTNATATAKIVPMRERTLPAAGSVIAFDDKALKSLAVLASSIMFQAPQFAAQTNPQNILGLADLMHKYMTGEVVMTQPETKESNS